MAAAKKINFRQEDGPEEDGRQEASNRRRQTDGEAEEPRRRPERSPARAASKKPTAKKAAAKKPARPARSGRGPAASRREKAAAKTKRSAATGGHPDVPSMLTNDVPDRVEIPAPRGVSKDGVAYTKDFDVKFLKAQRDELEQRRAARVGAGDPARGRGDQPHRGRRDGRRAVRRRGRRGRHDGRPARPRPVLSSQARQTIDRDRRRARADREGTYGYSEVSGSRSRESASRRSRRRRCWPRRRSAASAADRTQGATPTMSAAARGGRRI